MKKVAILGAGRFERKLKIIIDAINNYFQFLIHSSINPKLTINNYLCIYTEPVVTEK